MGGNSQKEAVESVNGQTLLLAVPGSGKTTVIITRVGYMIICKKIDPDKILNITFSKAATLDMKKKFITTFTELGDRIEFRTIHSLCQNIITYYCNAGNKIAFKIMTDTQISDAIRKIYMSMQNDYLKENDLKEIKTLITYCVNMEISQGEIKNLNGDFEFDVLLKKYKEFKIQNKLMDFDDQLKFALTILNNYNSILNYFQEKYMYISVDEAQDTSKLQYDIINLIASKYKNIFMVGDEDQSIYGFRAAFPQALLDFKKIYPNGVVLKMEQNYRSTKTIVDAAEYFIQRNKNRYDKNMFTKNEIGNAIKHTVLDNCSDQYNYLSSIAKDVESKTAILFRSNESSIPLIDLFEKNNIPYYMKEYDTSFFSHFIVRDIEYIINIFKDLHDFDSFQKIYYKLGVGIKKTEIEHLEKIHSSFDSIFDALLVICYELRKVEKIKILKQNFINLSSECSFDALQRILYKMGYNDYLDNKNISKQLVQMKNIPNSYVQKINVLLSLAKQNPNLNSFIYRLSELNKISQTKKNESSNIVLSTVHSSKGLEYDKVIIIDIIDGIFPSFEYDEINNLSPEEINILEEERRLFYVAVTRAKKELEIISCKKNYNNPCSVSFFIKQFLSQKPIQIPKSIPITKPLISNDIQKLYKIGTKIVHTSYGPGIITKANGNIYSIQFSADDTRQFDIMICVNNGIVYLENK